jgi:hypothetical protein
VSADQPLTGDELATIKARAEDLSAVALAYRDTMRLIAEVERLRAQVAEHEPDWHGCVDRVRERHTGHTP